MPVRLDNGFRWNVTMNWSKNNSEVTELYGDLETLVLRSLLEHEHRGPEG